MRKFFMVCDVQGRHQCINLDQVVRVYQDSTRIPKDNYKEKHPVTVIELTSFIQHGADEEPFGESLEVICNAEEFGKFFKMLAE